MIALLKALAILLGATGAVLVALHLGLVLDWAVTRAGGKLPPVTLGWFLTMAAVAAVTGGWLALVAWDWIWP